MKNKISLVGSFSILFSLVSYAWSEQTRIAINDKEYFAAPGFAFLLFHNDYQVGHQGGLQMIQQEERLLDSGDLWLIGQKGSNQPQLQILDRTIDRQSQTATIIGEAAGWNLKYQLVCHSDGQSLQIILRLDKPLDWSSAREAGFKIDLYPGAYYQKSYQSDRGSGVFARQFMGRPVLVESAKKLVIAQEDPLHSFTISSPRASLRLMDMRQNDTSGWFQIVTPIPQGSTETEVSLTITPNIDPNWRRKPVIEVSQVGYHPKQPKKLILELDPRDSLNAPVNIYRLQAAGDKELALSRNPKPWGQFLRYQYALLDFSELNQSGLYWIEYGGQAAGPIRISADLYQGVWQPTLETFLPVQMCHVAVRDGNRTWHGACHLDDALQAPAGKIYIDGYQQGERETQYADNQHVDGLDWGGWHDAGDNDLPAGSIAITTLPLALAQEEFHPELDQTKINRIEREVWLHAPDGQPDLLQQIAFGAESLLILYRPSGHVFAGIIESTDEAYGHVGDTINVTDNHVFDSKLGPTEIVCDRSGRLDDRWVFTNRNTGLQYETAQALAAASRALRATQERLAADCLETARKLWAYEQSHPPIYAPNAYAPRDSGYRSQELAAAAELLITTGEKAFQDRLETLLLKQTPLTAEQFGGGPGWVLVRAFPKISSPELKNVVRELAGKYKSMLDTRMASNPYGVPYPLEVSNPGYKVEARSHIHSGFVWGRGWDLQELALQSYYYQKYLPEIFGKDLLLNVVNYVLGCHPANNRTFVSGVGIDSPIVAYGFNRDDWTHIPGGVISGSSLIKPDFMELKEFPHLWYQTEYVISGAATYIFDVLAADHWLGP